MRSRRGWRSGRRGEEPKEQDYWLSYSDLMAGLLMVFVLMLLVAAHQYTDSRNRLDNLSNTMIGVVRTMEVRDSIIDRLQGVEGDGVSVITVDTVTAAIRLNDAVLFDHGSATLRPEGQRALREFVDSYLPRILGDPYVNGHLRQISVEGHTDTVASYAFNLRLSQDRAYSVMTFLLANAPGRYGPDLRRLLVANGLSESYPVCGDTVMWAEDCSSPDLAASRRIEIQFRLSDEEVVRELRRLLDEAVWLRPS